MPIPVDTLVTGGAVYLDGALHDTALAIRDGTIVGAGDPGAYTAREVVDATGLYVLPGVVDPHMHLACVFSDDDFQSATRSAAFGGVTSVLDFTFQEPGRLPSDAFRDKAAIGERDSYVDFSFHCAVTQENPETVRDVAALIELGATTSFKFFMAYDFGVSTGFIFDCLEQIGRAGGLGMVHAEDPSVIDYRVRDYQARGKAAPPNFAHAHPNFSEESAVALCAVLSREARAPLYIVHVSTAEGAAVIRRARAEGVPIFGETCPHYLTVTAAEYERTGALGIMCPPLRGEPDVRGLWDAVRDGTLDCIGTDHAAFTAARKAPGHQEFWRSPFGAPGVETVLPILYEHGVRRGRISLAHLISLLCERPAERFGCPTKGSLAPGKDADVVFFDPNRRVEIRASEMHTVSDYSLYEGWRNTGWPIHTMVRGAFVVRDRALVGHPGHGTSLPRATPHR